MTTDHRWRPNERWWWPTAVVLTVLPIVVATIRAARSGWIPAGDAAATVLRAGAVSFRSPSLVGMFTDASHWARHPTFFPGPWQLWWMAPPVRVLGSTWGPTLSMALLNALWMLLVAWVLRRRFGASTAVAALGFLGILLWTLSMNAVFSPIPMVMIVPAFAAFMFLTWAVAAGDDAALGWFALSANFCLLGHLVLTIVVPLVGGVGIALWCAGRFHERRTGASPGPVIRRTRRRGLVAAVVVTAVMWLPALVQQLTTQPGNLSNLLHAQANRPRVAASWHRGLSILVDLFSPGDPWVSRSSIRRGLVPRIQSVPPLTTTRVVVFILAGLAVIALLALAVRRRDRSATTAVVLAVAAFIAALTNQAHVPTDRFVNTAYYLSNNVVAMFVTFALAYSIARLAPPRTRVFAAWGSMGLVAVMSIANFGPGQILDSTTMTSAETLRTSASLNRQLVPQLHDSGVVTFSSNSSDTYSSRTAFVVAATDASVPVCAPRIPQLAGAPMADCPDHGPRLTLDFIHVSGARRPKPGWQRLAYADALTSSERAELAKLGSEVTNAVQVLDRSGRSVDFTDAEKNYLTGKGIDLGVFRGLFDAVNPPTAREREATMSARLGAFVTLVKLANGIDDPERPVAFRLPGVSTDDLRRWVELADRRARTATSVWAPRRPTTG